VIAATLLERIRHFTATEEASAVEAALLINQCLDENLADEPLRARLAEIAEDYDGRHPPWQYLRDLGFGSGVDVEVPSGSRMDRLLASREGLPITLGTLLIHVSDSAGLVVRGINFPGRFLVQVGDAIVDPFVMASRSRESCLESLPGSLRGEDVFEEAPPRSILLRMFNNLKYHYANQDEFHNALDMVECQLGALPGDAGLLLEQGEFWLRLGSVGAARRAFRLAEVAASSGGEQRRSEIALLARSRLEALPDVDDLLH
jgi:regulator of sirC expression with transglutaminase-like and TPR domain